MAPKLVLDQAHLLPLTPQQVQLLLLLLNIPNLVHLFFLKLVNNVLFQVLLRHDDVVEILVDVERNLWTSMSVSLLLLKEACSCILADVELIPEHTVDLVLLMRELAGDLPPSESSNPRIRQFALQFSS